MHATVWDCLRCTIEWRLSRPDKYRLTVNSRSMEKWGKAVVEVYDGLKKGSCIEGKWTFLFALIEHVVAPAKSTCRTSCSAVQLRQKEVSSANINNPKANSFQRASVELLFLGHFVRSQILLEGLKKHGKSVSQGTRLGFELDCFWIRSHCTTCY
jgi:hypothetical protein